MLVPVRLRMNRQLASVLENGLWQFTAGVSLLIVSTCLIQAPAFSQETGWAIEQNDKLFGRTMTYISKRGLLRNFPQMGGSTVTLGPDWKLLFFSDETKMCCAMTMDDWRKFLSQATVGLRATVPESLIKQALTEGRSLTMNGLRATSYTLQTDRSDAGRSSAFNCVQTINVVLADEVVMPLSLAKVYSDCYCLPFSTRMPLQIEHVYSPTHKTKILSTIKISSMPSTANMIRFPTGYKRAKSALEVTTGGLINDLLKDVVPTMDNSAKPGTQASPEK